MQDNNNFGLTIKTPCHEDWNKMSSSQQGRFCNACEKTVIDFSKLSDSEIIDFFDNYRKNTPNTKICGRFSERQLNARYPRQAQKTNFNTIFEAQKSTKNSLQNSLKNVALGLSLLATLAQIPTAAAANWKAAAQQPLTEQTDRRPNPEDEQLSLWQRLTNQRPKIRGYILMDSEIVVPKARVCLYINHELITTTHSDSKGYYSIALPKNTEKNDIIYINAEKSHRSGSEVVTIDDFKTNEILNIHLQIMMMGDVIER
jgi:hypothetical protein